MSYIEVEGFDSEATLKKQAIIAGIRMCIDNPFRTEYPKKGWNNCAVTVQNKRVAVSTAIGSFVHERVDIYECDNVFAIINNTEGKFHVIPDTLGGDRKIICSRPLVRYLREKCEQNYSHRLNAWLDRGIVMFCIGTLVKAVRFHSGFRPITNLPYLRYDNSVKIDGRRFILTASLSKTLDEKLSVYKHGKMFAFLNDDRGMLRTEDRNEFGTKAIIGAQSVIPQVKNELGKGPWFGTSVPGGVIFSGDDHIEKKPIVTTNMFSKIYISRPSLDIPPAMLQC